MNLDERQVSPTINGIRRDHVARYEWAAKQLKKNKSVLDVACGVGYGSNIMAKAGLVVSAMDIDKEAVEYARKHYKHPRAVFSNQDVSKLEITESGSAVAFECIEHIKDPRPMLKSLAKVTGVLLASVPNETVFPWNNTKYHFRHYTKKQFEALLNECGWFVEKWYGQEGPESEVLPDMNGRTIIAQCVKGEPVNNNVLDPTSKSKSKSNPKHVTILGLGPSLDEYTNITKRLGGRHQYCDETWSINSLGAVIQCDKIFHMDDVRVQELRAKANPESNIAAMVKWMKSTDIPIITSRPHPGYKTTEPFPLIEVLNAFDTGYFNSTAAYAVAYAVWLGVEKISLFGVDFTYPDAHDAEKGRACVEYWLGMASERKIKIAIPRGSTLLDAIHTQRERFYGYDTLDLDITQSPDGFIDIKFTEREDIPTAEEIEESYNHKNHPNELVSHEIQSS